MNEICLIVWSVGKIAYTPHIFAATTAVLPMNREMQGCSVSV